jgi:hypothetical protein
LTFPVSDGESGTEDTPVLLLRLSSSSSSFFFLLLRPLLLLLLLLLFLRYWYSCRLMISHADRQFEH